MPVNVQIRNVADDTHRRLKAQAVEYGLSLSEYLLREVTKLAAYPTEAEIRARLARRRPVKIAPQEVLAAIQAGRAGR
ncbi:MAG: hypothetical protein HZB13_17950 [Acidobacteria bacterium]|nr:hypothetical protein [Acidobacteriota bacterium]